MKTLIRHKIFPAKTPEVAAYIAKCLNKGESRGYDSEDCYVVYVHEKKTLPNYFVNHVITLINGILLTIDD